MEEFVFHNSFLSRITDESRPVPSLLCINEHLDRWSAPQDSWLNSCPRLTRPNRSKLTLFEGVINVQHGEVVPVDVGKSGLGFIGGFLRFRWAHEALRNCRRTTQGRAAAPAAHTAQSDYVTSRHGVA